MTNSFEISLANEQTALPIDEDSLKRAVAAVLTDAEVTAAEISLAIVTDEVIHDLNIRYLEHDYPTDVLSFPLGDDGNVLAGEIVVSADTAATQALQHSQSQPSPVKPWQASTVKPWQANNELLLYVVHGALHLVGYGDKSPDSAAEMRAAEDRILSQFGLVVPREPSPNEDLPSEDVPNEDSQGQSESTRAIGETA